MGFEVGEKAIVPNMGVGILKEIETVSVAEVDYRMLVFKILYNGSVYKTPETKAEANGIRPIIPVDAVEKVYDVLRDRETPTDKQTWNRRYREYMNKIKTGDPLEVAAVLRDLALLKSEKALSFGERKMYDQAHSLIVQEIAVARDVDEKVITKEIDDIFVN